MSSKTPEGELTAPELRKLIRAHNILSKIVIPKGTDRQGLIKLIEGKNYKVDHKDKVIRPKQQRGKQITLKKAEELTKPKPVSEEVKKKRAEKKKEQEEAKQKDIKIAKKEAVKEFKSKQKEAKKKQVKKPVKKEEEVRPKEKVGRPKVDPKKIKVIEPKKEEKYNLFLKLFNEAKERRNRKPFQELRDRIFRYSEPFLYGTKLKPKSDGETLKAQKDPEFLKIKSLLDKVDNELEKYFKIGGLKYPKPKPLIISNKPALNTKKIEPKKKEEPKKEEPIKNERYKITEKFMKDNDIFSEKLISMYKESGEQTPEFKKLYKQKQRLIAKYISENGGQSITTELKKLKTPWLKAWIESDDAYEKFLKRYKKYPLISNGDNFLDYLKSRFV